MSSAPTGTIAGTPCVFHESYAYALISPEMKSTPSNGWGSFTNASPRIQNQHGVTGEPREGASLKTVHLPQSTQNRSLLRFRDNLHGFFFFRSLKQFVDVFKFYGAIIPFAG